MKSPVAGRIVILKDGAVLLDETGSSGKEIAIVERGVYRAEVYLPQLGSLVAGQSRGSSRTPFT